MNDELAQRLSATSRQPGHVTPTDFNAEVNSQGQRSEILTHQADTATMLREGPANALKVAIPAYQKETTNATADDSETFALTHSVVDAPVTQSVVCWLDGDYYGTPDSVDYDANKITVSDAGTNSNLHIYYVSDKAATVEIRKVAPGETTSKSQRVYTANLGLVHGTPQLEQPEFLTLNKSALQAWVAADMTLAVYVDAPYTVRWTDADGDGTEPTNALFHVPVFRGSSEVPGLAGAVGRDMGQA